MGIAGRGNLFVDGKLAVDLSVDPPQGDSFFGLGTADVRTVFKGLKAGEPHSIEIRLGNEEFIARGPPFFCRGGIRLGAVPKIADEDGIQSAVKLAKESDGALFVSCLRGLLIVILVVILVIGLNNE